MKKFRRILALGLSVVTAMSLVAGCGKDDDTSRDNETFLTVNGIEVPLKVGKFYAYNEQASYEAYYLANGYSLDWSTLYEEEVTTKKPATETTTAEGTTTEGTTTEGTTTEGTTTEGTTTEGTTTEGTTTEGETPGKYPIEDLVKKDVLERIKMFYVISQYAKENGATLTAEDTKEIAEFTKNYLEGNKKVVDATNADEEFLASVYGIEAYYNKGCDMIFKDVDFGIVDEDIRQVSIVAIELPKNSVEFPEDTAKAIVARLDAGEKLEDIAKFYGISSLVAKGSLGKGDFAGDKVEELALSLKTGEHGYIVDKDVHIIVCCIDDNDEEATKAVKESLIAQKKSEKLAEFYEEYTKNMEITLNEELWDTVTFKNPIFTEEDVSDILKQYENGTTESTTTAAK